VLRTPHCLDNRLIDGGKVVSLTHQPRFTPQKHYYFNVSGNMSNNSGGLTFGLQDSHDLTIMLSFYALYIMNPWQ
jgi:hypothetical protein